MIAARYRVGLNAPKDARRAAEWCLISAEAGDAGAQNLLGELYETGDGIQDFAEAAQWYRKAAEERPSCYDKRTFALPIANLARLYAAGKGVPQDYAAAAKLFQRATELNGYSGQYGLGLLYERGLGVPRDLKRATELYHEVAALNGDAKRRLFALYEARLPVPQDEHDAISWYRAAAERGNVWAQAGLGLRYQFGKGVERNWSVAYALYNLAARSSSRARDEMPDLTGPATTASIYTRWRRPAIC